MTFSRSEMMDESKMLSVNKVAKFLDCSTRHVYRLEERGQMPAAARLGHLVRWPREAIDAWIEGGCRPTTAV